MAFVVLKSRSVSSKNRLASKDKVTGNELLPSTGLTSTTRRDLEPQSTNVYHSSTGIIQLQYKINISDDNRLRIFAGSKWIVAQVEI